MSNLHSSNKQGFTIVEIVVVIVVIAILAVVGVIGYGSWRESIATKAVKADLQTIESSMSSSSNFSDSGFPLAVPNSFKSSDEVEVEYVRGDAKTYCIEGRSTAVSSVIWHIEGKVGSSTIATGAC